MATVNFGIIDDGYPVTGKTKLEFDEIQQLTSVDEWDIETSLRDLNMQLILKSIHWKKRIHLNAFYNPEFFFTAEKRKWDFLAFDWEYKMQQSGKSSEVYLLEILETTRAKVFVFSGWETEDHISSMISDSVFDRYKKANRLELLRKSEDRSVVKMLEKVTFLFEKGEEVVFENVPLIIKPSKHIVDSEDFWVLKSLIGADNILSVLKEMNSNTVDEGTIQFMFEKSRYNFFIDNHKSILSASNNQLINEKFGELKALSMIDALNIFGIEKLEETKEKGYSKIK